MSAVFGSYDGQLENTSSMSDVADVFRTHCSWPPNFMQPFVHGLNRVPFPPFDKPNIISNALTERLLIYQFSPPVIQVEGAVGYGHWVCSMLLLSDRKDTPAFVYAIQEMGAVPTASDALHRYTGHPP